MPSPRVYMCLEWKIDQVQTLPDLSFFIRPEPFKVNILFELLSDIRSCLFRVQQPPCLEPSPHGWSEPGGPIPFLKFHVNFVPRELMFEDRCQPVCRPCFF